MWLLCLYTLSATATMPPATYGISTQKQGHGVRSTRLSFLMVHLSIIDQISAKSEPRKIISLVKYDISHKVTQQCSSYPNIQNVHLTVRQVIQLSATECFRKNEYLDDSINFACFFRNHLASKGESVCRKI